MFNSWNLQNYLKLSKINVLKNIIINEIKISKYTYFANSGFENYYIILGIFLSSYSNIFIFY